MLGTDEDYVVAIDTDSGIYDFTALMKAKGRIGLPEQENVDWLDALATKVLEPKFVEWFDEFAEYLNSYQNVLNFQREVISSASFWTAKKRYAMVVLDNEGYRFPEGKPDIKHMGLETKRSSTPEHNKEGLLTCIEKILLEGEEALQKFVVGYEKSYYNATIDEICQVSTANNLNKHCDERMYPVKGCPGHLKGALLFNRLAKKHGFDPIVSGDRIAFVTLKQPNTFDTSNAEALAWSSGTPVPQELREDLERYVDRDDMYNKHFERTLQGWCEVVGMSLVNETTVDDFF